jgi:hypothetical protein
VSIPKGIGSGNQSFDQFFWGGVVVVARAVGKTVKRRLERPIREQADCYTYQAAKQNPRRIERNEGYTVSSIFAWKIKGKTNTATACEAIAVFIQIS